MNNQENQESLYSIAIVGMAGRFPGAKNIDEFWHNLRDGVESISIFSEEELEAELDQAIFQDPNYVKARAVLEDVDLFDAAFFGFNPREAEIIDPQHRLFLESAWEALEHSGYNPETYEGSIGVFASTQMSSYLLFNLYPNRDVLHSAGLLAIRIANDRDFLATRVSYKLNLRGPSLNIQTACSSSLVACHVACQSLLDYQCDMALVGGISVNVPQKSGYIYQVGSIYSPDGHCRAFDAQAQGTVSGSGLGVVVLKRLEDALAAGDTIHAVIKGSAINNDGSLKVGYTAPSVQGQAEAIAAAQAVAEIDIETITYIEAHGTATALGDPVEIAALTQVFSQSTEKKGFCAIGSVKSNIGHLDAAAGVASLIKTVSALKHKLIPPSLNCSEPNPEINFPNTPFYVNTKLTEWQTDHTPRRAGVSSFGVGGTNAHVVLEEAPTQIPSGESRSWQLLFLSARTASALEQQTQQLIAHLQQHPDLTLADVAFTLHVGRKAFEHRQILVCENLEDAVISLKNRDPQRVFNSFQPEGEKPIAFMFPGQGTQYVNMAGELYQSQATFHQEIDRCAELLKPCLGLDVRDILYPDANHADIATKQLQQTSLTQPILFVVEYALAKLWMEWGVCPQMMIGHSIGEYVAACLAGVFSLEDALMLVAERGRLMQSLPHGTMLAISLAKQDVKPLLGNKLSLAAVNGPSLCVVAGSTDVVETLQAQLAAKGVECRQLHTSHAFHSAMMDPILRAFAERVQQVRLQPPQIPYLSNLTGTWMTAQDATDPSYWVKHLRHTVRFWDGITTLLDKFNGIALEVGPGRTLTTLAQQYSNGTTEAILLTSLRHPREQSSDVKFLLKTLGKLWLSGAKVDWLAFYATQQRRRLPLPTYPFQRQRYWIEPPSKISAPTLPQKSAAWNEEKDQSFSQHPRPFLESAYIAPSTATEQAIAQIWQELLGLSQVGVNDNFFELGGHSLLGTQVVSRIRDTLGIEIPLDKLFEVATIAELSKHIEIQSQSNQHQQDATIPKAPRDEILPLSFAQQRLWFLHQIEPTNTSYNLVFAVRLTGTLNLTILEQSFNEIVRHHEVLRTRFITKDGKPSQVIAPPQTLELSVVNLETLSAEKQDAEVQRLISKQAQQPFDLSQDSLIRINILQLNETEHIVWWTMHHIVVDGWSVGILIRELAALYQAFAAQQPSPLPELPIQYADFALWQRQWLQGPVLEAQLSYWKQQLSNLPVLELPTDRPRPPIQTFLGTRQTFTINPNLTKALHTLSQQQGITLFMTLLAAFKTLLFRYTGQEDFAVGSPIANRNRSEIEGLIGFFVNTLVLRIDLSGNPTFRNLLSRVREVALGAYAHQDLPFEKLVEALQPERDISHTPLFQVMFALQNTPMPNLTMEELTLSGLEVDSGTAQFDLTLEISESVSGLVGWFEYKTDLFDGETITRMAVHFSTLLEGIVADPDRCLADLPLLTEVEHHQLLVEWNDTQVEYTDTCIHQLFEAQVERTPEAIAVVFKDEQLSYRELNRQANQLAHHLRTLGIGSETRVGICTDRSLKMVIGLLGILKSGGAYVPLDPAYPQERLALIVEDAQVSVLLTQKNLAAGFSPLQIHIVCLDTEWELISQSSQEKPNSDVEASNLAYVIYTSGSTGKPKGVLIEHRNVVRLFCATQSSFNFNQSDVWTLFHSYAFDFSVWEIWGALLYGGRLVIVPFWISRSPELFHELLVKEKVTVLNQTPSAFRQLIQANLSSLQVDNLSLRLVIFGGEALDIQSLKPWFDKHGDLSPQLINMYGITETTVHVTYRPITTADLSSKGSMIGSPIPDLQIYILDKYLQPIPIGVPGEMYVGGAGVSRGYLNQPELTAITFIPNPFSKELGVRLYKTGDLVRYRPDGNIEFLGRIDHQVKVRGFRIELGEVEAVLSQHPDVREVAIVARNIKQGYDSQQLVAYVVPNQEQTLTSSELRAFLEQKLPEYMVPSAFVMLNFLPLTPNGKVDRKGLSVPDRERDDLEEQFVAPRTPTEAQLAKIWSQVLRLERIGVYDNFFELGGDSILSIQIVAKANQAGLHLTPKHLFEHRTIAALAPVVGIHATIQAEQGLVTGAVPLTPIQRWFFDQEFSEPHHWNQAVMLEVQDSLDPALLEQVLQCLLLHHDALRQRFIYEEEIGWQQLGLGTDVAVPFTQVDLSALSKTKQRAAIETRAAELQTTLDLTKGPLMRMSLFELGADKPGRLLIVIHHLIIDGVSWRILLEDLQTAYQQLYNGEAVILPPKTTSFKHWAERLTAYAQSEALEQTQDYWLSQLQESVDPLPSDYLHTEGANTVISSHTVLVTLSTEETKALLQDAPVVYNTQINDVLLTALVQAFTHWTGSSSLLLDLEGHGREEIIEDLDLSRTVGWFTTVFPVLLELEGVFSAGEALKSIKEQLRRIPDKGIGYGLLRYLSQNDQIVEKLRELPLAMVSFNYLGQIDQTHTKSALLKLAQESSGPICSPKGIRTHLLEINGSVFEGQLQMEWTYSQNIHNRNTIEQLAQDFLEVLRSLIAHCQNTDVGSYTPSDFPDENLTQEELDIILLQLGD